MTSLDRTRHHRTPARSLRAGHTDTVTRPGGGRVGPAPSGHRVVEHGVRRMSVERASGAIATSTGSCASPLTGSSGVHDGFDLAGDVASAGQPADMQAPMLFAPAQAVEMLQVRESWLRRRAARRQVPCTFLGKHLRFSRADLDRILADAAQPVMTNQRGTTHTSVAPGRGDRPGARGRTGSHQPGPK
jgi:hypothetical protein